MEVKCSYCFKEIDISKKEIKEAFPDLCEECIKNVIALAMYDATEVVNGKDRSGVYITDKTRHIKTNNTVLIGKTGGVVDILCCEYLKDDSDLKRDYTVRVEVVIDPKTKYPKLAVKILKTRAGDYPEEYDEKIKGWHTVYSNI